MDVKYCEYSLTPLRALNRHDHLSEKKGVYLSVKLNGEYHFADFFPHITLGDENVVQFLEGFKFQKTEYQKKVFHHLNHDPSYLKLELKKFKNHQLWSDGEELKTNVIKTKVFNSSDRHFLLPLSQGKRVRLDFNGAETKQEVLEVWESIPTHQRFLIDYFEDPLKSNDWSQLPFPMARDFINGTPFTFKILKPNREFSKDASSPTIYSTYMGSPLGTWHAYADLLINGDLNQVHGLIASKFYQDQPEVFEGNFDEGFYPNKDKIRDIYHQLTHLNWKTLCSI